MLPEFAIIVLTVFHEASICDEAEMRAVARTIQVRAQEQGISMREVCLQPNQYSCWNGKNKLKILERYDSGKDFQTLAWRRARKVAREIMLGEWDCLPKWNHYYNPKLCNPKWAYALKETKQFKHHLFGRIEK